ncbi:VOC family protein [Streptomyces aidingensis]|uniref:VOC domain-containing protein n=1 Tax=Streptomyces aidingensis TaxID=910347 RepID=A0A1I1GS48_9ACTN|nr:VOC family protein [Streptomyces aidingensis]SFC11880.1 hypothetical protein SAMN05421773_10225 [Streptomyces aidingensis]
MAIATLGAVALDCPDPRALAGFYGAVLGWQTDGEPGENEWVELKGPQGQVLAFQRSEGHRPPDWPGTEHGQQFHLDLDVPREKLAEAEQQALALGARLLEGDDGKRNWRVYADPAGHPFCLCF